jgi:hypothetical protein
MQTMFDWFLAASAAMLVASLLFFPKKRTIVLLVGLSVLVVAGGIRLLGVLHLAGSIHESFRTLTMENVAPGDELTLSGENGNGRLYNATQHDWVTYRDFEFKHYRFVYLSKIDRHYVAVLSLDESKTYADGRFYQADRERLDTIDQLVFLDVDRATMFALDENELIGRSIDLFSMQASAEGVAYKVYHPFSDKTFAYYASYFLYSEHIAILFTGSPTLSPSVYFFPILGGEDQGVFDWIDAFYWGDSAIALIVAQGEATAVRTIFDIQIENGYIQSFGVNFDDLTIHGGTTHLLQGYCMRYEGTIYYVDDDLRLRSIGSTVVHEENVDLAHWTQFIPMF